MDIDAQLDMTALRGPIAPAASAEETADRQAVLALTPLYAFSIDTRDLEMLLSVFDPDGTVRGTMTSGRAADYLPNVLAGASVYHRTMHNIVNQYVRLDGDDALVWNYAVACHMEEPGSGREDLIMAVIYKDRARRTERGWWIAEREVDLQWYRGPFPRGE